MPLFVATRAKQLRSAFAIWGPSDASKPLASGELRRQIGLKLKAQDSCNLLYAMWHIEPDSKIAVSIKLNPGKHRHEECGAGGYVNIKPQKRVDMPKLLPGGPHTLRGELRGTHLTVVADGIVGWEGTIGNIAGVDFDGPVGFRTDNARFELDYYAEVRDADAQSNINRCLRSAGNY